jgi:hypothetical protein
MRHDRCAIMTSQSYTAGRIAPAWTFVVASVFVSSAS